MNGQIGSKDQFLHSSIMGRGSRKKPKSCKEGLFPLFCAILVCQQIRQTTGPSFNKGFRSFAPESEKNPEEFASAKRHPN